MKTSFIKEPYASFVNHLFQILLITYLILLLAEQIWTGFVSVYLNLNYLLVLVIIVGVLDVFSEHPIYQPSKIKKIDYLFIFVLGILGFAIIKYKTLALSSWLSWIVSLTAGILIILLSILVLEDDETQNLHTKTKTKSPLNPKKVGFAVLILLAVVSFLLPSFTSLSYLESFRIVFGSIYVLFLPGFIISFIFFPKTKPYEDSQSEEKTNTASIDWLERIALSFALSIAIVPLVIFYLNLIGVKINLFNSFFTVLEIIVVSSVILYVKTILSKKNS